LVVRDEEGKPYNVRYEAVNAMLPNEFLKEHLKIEQQAATITELKAADTKLEATVAQQQATNAEQQQDTLRPSLLPSGSRQRKSWR